MIHVPEEKWTAQETELLSKIYLEGISLDEIAKALPNRSFRSIEHKIRRLGLKRPPSPQGGGGGPRKISFDEIQAERIIEREEALKILAGAIEKLQKGGKMEEEELFRIRTIIMAIRGYFAVFNSYEKYAELDERIRRLEEDARKDLEKT